MAFAPVETEYIDNGDGTTTIRKTRAGRFVSATTVRDEVMPSSMGLLDQEWTRDR
jgi:hypothetical protein